MLWHACLAVLVLLAGFPAHAAEDRAQAQFDFANGLFHHGMFEEAVEEYETFITRHAGHPEAPLARYRLGEAAYAAGQYEKALEAFDALEVGAGEAVEGLRPQARLSKGEVLVFLDRFEEARELLQPLAASEQPAESRSRALYFLAKAQHELGQHAPAAQTLRTLLADLPRDPLAPYARYQLAFTLLAQNELEEAAVEFSAVATANIDPELRMESRFRAAEIYDKMGWFSTAVGAYEQLRSEYPDSEYARRAEYGYAWALYHDGKHPEALEAADRFLRENPDSPYLPGLKYLRGNSLQQQRQYAEALAAFQDLREHHGETAFAVRAQYKSAWVNYLSGNIAAAKADVLAFVSVHRESPLWGDAHFLLGNLHIAEGNFEPAQQAFTLVAEEFPQSEFAAEALFKAAEARGHLGLSSQAAEAYAQFAQRWPEHPLASQAMLRAADAQFQAHDFAGAVARYKEILERGAEPAVDENTRYRLALTHHNARQYEESAAAFQQLIERFPESEHLAESWFRIGEWRLREEGEADKALPAYQAALDAAPEGQFAGRALLGLALARFENEDHDEAAALFLRVAQEHPELSLNEESYVWTAQHFFDQQQWEQAETSFEALLAAVPDYPYPERARLLIAQAREESGNEAAALEGYEAVMAAAPESTSAVEARFRMAALHERNGDVERALALYEEAAETSSGDVAARARFRLGELFEEQGEHDKAARSFMRVAILFLHEDLSPESLWRAGNSFANGGSVEQARRAYEELLSDYPDSPHAAQARSALEALASGQAEAGAGTDEG